MDSGLKDKVAFITGAGSQIGFGKATALALAKEGCHVAVSDIDLKGAQQTAAAVKALGRKSMALKLDVANHNEAKKVIDEVIAELGKIDILVNNAGACSGLKPFMETTEADWDFDINVNFKGTLNCCQAVLPGMIERKYGKIINISSGGGIDGGPRGVTYASAKGAVIIFTKSLAVEMAAIGINVNAIAPGFADTGFARTAPPGLIEKVVKTIPVGRLTDVQDIANAVVFLASSLSNDIVGQTLRVAGTI
jgi:NAD(P)-dependent dehydrogenase (short-subunit alcohol dehydrogenase family)